MSEPVGELFAAQGSRSLRLARLVSDVGNPLFVSVPTDLAVSLSSAPSAGRALAWWLTTTLLLTVAPLAYVLIGVRRGWFTDHHISRRDQRTGPLLVGLSLTALTFLTLLALAASRALIATLVAVFAAGLAALVITRRWKVSLHAVGSTGALAVLVWLFGAGLLWLTPLLALIGWARWRVRAHTVAQILAGALLAVGVVCGVFLAAGVPAHG